MCQHNILPGIWKISNVNAAEAQGSVWQTMSWFRYEMHHVCHHIVPRILTQEQCDDHMKISDEFIHTADDHPDFL
jgi:hypothetical protein